MVRLTKSAADKVKEDAAKKSLPENTVLRIEAQPMPEKGKVELALTFDTKEPSETDDVATTEGVRLAINKQLANQIGNAQLDFRDGNFVFERVEPT